MSWPLETERLRLRPFVPDDASALVQIIDESRAAFRLRFSNPLPTVYTEGVARDYIERLAMEWQEGTRLTLGMERKSDGRIVGASIAMLWEPQVPCWKIGYWVRGSAEGHGYAAEGTRALIDYCFDTLKAHRLYLRCDADNVASARIAEKLGFTLEGTLREHRRDVDGALHDRLYYGMLAP